MEILNLRSQRNAFTFHRKPTKFFNTFFMERLIITDKKFNFQNVRRWLGRPGQKTNVQTFEKIIIPINITNSHWTLLVIFMDEKLILYIDGKPTKVADLYLTAAHQWLSCEGVDVSNFTLGKMTNNPKQPKGDGFNCGVMVCMAADFISDNLRLEFQSVDSDNYRYLMGNSILNADFQMPQSNLPVNAAFYNYQKVQPNLNHQVFIDGDYTGYIAR